MQQEKNKFDKASLIKIARGALIAGTGAGALYFLDAIGKIDIGVLTPLIGAIVPIAVNAIREYMTGTIYED